MRNSLLFTPLLLALTQLAQAAEPEFSGPEPTAAQAQQWLDEGYLPRQQALTRAAEQLASRSATLCAKPDEAQLQATRQAWLATSSAWRALDGAPAGPMVLARLGRKIDFRPTRIAELEAAINGGPANVATQGLGAAEYLLWGDNQPKAQLAKLKNPARCGYLQQITQQIATETHTLDEGWRIYREQLGAENPFFRRNMFSEHVNLLIASLTGLGKRMPTADAVSAEQFVEWRSGSSKAQLLAQLQGAALAYGGISRQLQDDGHSELDQRMQQALTSAQSSCGQLPANLDKATSAARLGCSKAIQQARKTLQDQVAEKLDLTLGFTEGDGD
ncbi:imelysin family protein [Chitinibacter tainanensis]|uniref:imelysin family protein n=1 Tax=Chitinibacter tainanensis TaxID=230667 RepID=UPI0023553891|nr:imelysin family protein [Chitinibacter tainanensis]